MTKMMLLVFLSFSTFTGLAAKADNSKLDYYEFNQGLVIGKIQKKNLNTWLARTFYILTPDGLIKKKPLGSSFNFQDSADEDSAGDEYLLSFDDQVKGGLLAFGFKPEIGNVYTPKWSPAKQDIQKLAESLIKLDPSDSESVFMAKSTLISSDKKWILAKSSKQTFLIKDGKILTQSEGGMFSGDLDFKGTFEMNGKPYIILKQNGDYTRDVIYIYDYSEGVVGDPLPKKYIPMMAVGGC